MNEQIHTIPVKLSNTPQINQQKKQVIPRGRPPKRTPPIQQIPQVQIWTQHIRVHLAAQVRYVQEVSGLTCGFIFKLNQKDKMNRLYSFEEMNKLMNTFSGREIRNIFEKRYYDFVMLMCRTKIKVASDEFYEIYELIYKFLKGKDFKIPLDRNEYEKFSEEIELIIVKQLKEHEQRYEIINLRGEFIQSQIRLEKDDKNEMKYSNQMNNNIEQNKKYDLAKFIKIIVHCVIGQIFNFQLNAYYLQIFTIPQIKKKNTSKHKTQLHPNIQHPHYLTHKPIKKIKLDKSNLT